MIDTSYIQNIIFEPLFIQVHSFSAFIKCSSLNRTCEQIAFKIFSHILNERDYAFSDLKLKLKDSLAHIQECVKMTRPIKMDQLPHIMLFDRLQQCVLFILADKDMWSEITTTYLEIKLGRNLEDNLYIDEIQGAVNLLERELLPIDPPKFRLSKPHFSSIPKEIGIISKYIQSLSLCKFNFFRSEFRAAKFTNLSEVSLDECHHLPSNIFTKKLVLLKIDNCSLENFDSLKLVKNVMKLRLRGIELTEIPDFLSNFTNLKELDVSNNKIQAVPPFIAERNLDKLILANNPIEALPDNLSVKGLYTSKQTKLPQRKEEAISWYRELTKINYARRDYLYDSDRVFGGMLLPEQEDELELIENQLKNLQEQFGIR